MVRDLKRVIGKFIKSFPLIERELIGFIPENRILAFISALEACSDQIEALAERINGKEAGKQWKISVLFRLILEFLRAVFRLNGHEIEQLLLNSENKVLINFLGNFSKHVFLSNEEWSNSKPIFHKYQPEMIELAWEIKTKYHKIVWDRYRESYAQNCLVNGQRAPLNHEDCLEHIDFTHFYPDQVLEWQNNYPDDLMLKAFIYMKLDMISSIPLLFKRLNDQIHFNHQLIRGTGMGLGFYFSSPKLDKLYRFKTNLTAHHLNQIIQSNAELLIQEGISDIVFMIGDSTACRARSDDPAAPRIEGTHQTLSRNHKYQAIVDGNGIPLLLYRRPGVEHDSKGFLSLQEALLQLKRMAQTHGRPIQFMVLDAGYFSEEIMDFIRNKMECTPIIDINSGNSQKLKRIKEGIEQIKQYNRDLRKLDPTNKPAVHQLEHAIQGEYKNLQAFLAIVQQDGTEFERKIAHWLLEVGLENYIRIYRNRPIIEGLFGMAKSCYYLLGRPDRQLPIKGEENVEVHGMLVIIAMQYLALFNYRLLGKEKNLLRALHYIRLSELTLYY